MTPADPSGGAPARRPHVLFAASSAEGYGADRMLVQSVIALADHRVTVLLPAEGPLRDRLEREGATVRVHRDFALRRRYLTPWRAPGLIGRNVVSVARLVRMHRRDPVDLVVTNTAAVLVGAAFARLICRPHVWHVHEILDGPPAFARLMARIIRRLSDRVIACSSAARGQLVALRPGLAARTVVVLNGIPLPDATSPRATGDADVVRIGCVGRIHARKGQRELVEAWASAVTRSASMPRLELHLFGDPLVGQEHLVAGLQALISRAGLAGQACFHGFVDDPDLVYGALDVVVVPSIQPESFSLVCAEAQAYGLPVIGPDHDGPEETVVDGETGLLVDPADTGALADAIIELASDARRRASLGAAGRLRAGTTFSLVRYRDGVRRVVDDLLADRMPARPPAPAAPDPAVMAEAVR